MKQYLKAKIIKWGYRIWKLCDASNAYVLNFDVYTGKEGKRNGKTLHHSVVMRLMEGYLDNSSTYACGTVRINRKNAKDSNPGESEFWQSGNFVIGRTS